MEKKDDKKEEGKKDDKKEKGKETGGIKCFEVRRLRWTISLTIFILTDLEVKNGSKVKGVNCYIQVYIQVSIQVHDGKWERKVKVVVSMTAIMQCTVILRKSKICLILVIFKYGTLTSLSVCSVQSV